MKEGEICNTTLGLGIGIGIKDDPKQSKNEKKGFWLDLSLHLDPKIETDDQNYKVNDDDHKKDDQGSFSSKTMDDQGSFSSKTTDDIDQVEKERAGTKRSVSNGVVYDYSNDHGSRKKLKLTTEQTTLLEDRFNIHSTLNTGQKQELAKKLNLLPRQIEVWFQNRRARTKMKQIEKECEMLKKCCATLNEENRRLKKELQEVRFFMRYPSATTMHRPFDKIDQKSGEEKKLALAVVNGNHEDSNKKINAAAAKFR